MKNKIWRVIGLMSGTSLDGVDLVYVKISKNKTYDFEILKKKSYFYSELWKNKLKEAFTCSPKELVNLDKDYGVFLGNLVLDFIVENQIQNIDFIASHGHTIFHRPEENYTLQIGNGLEISKMTKLKVICDFRTQDVKLGGQGAPLVPIGDKLFFSEFDFCLNLGGFANISFQESDQRMAFDICPVNIVLNHYTRKLNMEYDDKGILAKEGRLVGDLFNELNRISFYRDDEPKSLGYEFIVATVLPMIEKFELEIQDVLRTFIEHAAYQISKIINSNMKNSGDIRSRVLATGGGAYNDFLIQRISNFSNAQIIVPRDDIIEFKEAVVFALLGVLKDQNEINVLKSVTGASKDHSSGKIFYPS